MNSYQEEIYTIRPSTIPVRDSVYCHKCGAESGWTNDTLRYIKRDLNCKNCGKVCIKYLAGYVQITGVDNTNKGKKVAVENIEPEAI